MKNCHLIGAARRGVGVMSVFYQGRAGQGAQGWLLWGRNKVLPWGRRARQGQERQEASVAAEVGSCRSHRAWEVTETLAMILRSEDQRNPQSESVEQGKERMWERNVTTLGRYLGRSSLDTGFVQTKDKSSLSPRALNVECPVCYIGKNLHGSNINSLPKAPKE